MKKVIEKIEKIKGVEKVTETGSNELTVQVEYKWVVKIDNIEQWDFIWLKVRGSKPTDVSFLGHANSNGGVYDVIDTKDKSTQCEKYFTNMKYEVIPFSEYLSEYNLKDEWEKYLIGEAEKRYPKGTKFESIGKLPCSSVISEGRFSSHFSPTYPDAIKHDAMGLIYAHGKWATIIEPELELVSGEIYHAIHNGWNTCIFRFKSDNDTIYSNTGYAGNFYTNGTVGINNSQVAPATNKQKAKLIKAELKNGYLWNGEELIKYK